MKATLPAELQPRVVPAGAPIGAAFQGGPLTHSAGLPIVRPMHGLDHICGICREIIR